MQNVNRVSPGVNKVAVNTHERDETDLTEVSVSLVQAENGHVLDLADDVLLQVAKQHRGRIRRSYRRSHALIDDVGIAHDGVRSVHGKTGHQIGRPYLSSNCLMTFNDVSLSMYFAPRLYDGGLQAVPSETTFRRSFSAE